MYWGIRRHEIQTPNCVAIDHGHGGNNRTDLRHRNGCSARSRPGGRDEPASRPCRQHVWLQRRPVRPGQPRDDRQSPICDVVEQRPASHHRQAHPADRGMVHLRPLQGQRESPRLTGGSGRPQQHRPRSRFRRPDSRRRQHAFQRHAVRQIGEPAQHLLLDNHQQARPRLDPDHLPAVRPTLHRRPLPVLSGRNERQR